MNQLKIKIGTRYSYEYLVKCFGKEKLGGVETPEITFEIGGRTIDIMFESDRIITDRDEFVADSSRGYTLKGIYTWPTK